MPVAVGVPLIVMVPEAQEAVTPAGSPVAVPIPVAPVVVCVILVKAVLRQTVGVLDAAPAARLGLTVNVEVLLALTVLVQPPVPPEFNCVIVTVVEPALLSTGVVKLTLPAVVTVTLAVCPEAVLAPEML